MLCFLQSLALISSRLHWDLNLGICEINIHWLKVITNAPFRSVLWPSIDPGFLLIRRTQSSTIQGGNRWESPHGPTIPAWSLFFLFPLLRYSKVDNKGVPKAETLDIPFMSYFLSSMDSGLEAFSHYPTGLASQHCLIMQLYLPNARSIGSSRTLIDYSLYNQTLTVG